MIFAKYLPYNSPTMQDLQHLETTVLLDLLSIHTAEYTNMLNNNIKGEAFDKCKASISVLQSTINSRLQTPENTNVSGTDFEFTSEISQ